MAGSFVDQLHLTIFFHIPKIRSIVVNQKYND